MDTDKQSKMQQSNTVAHAKKFPSEKILKKVEKIKIRY